MEFALARDHGGHERAGERGAPTARQVHTWLGLFRQDRRQSPMTMKSTLIVPMTLLAALAAGVLVHDRLRTKSFVQDAAPTRTPSIATAKPAAPAPVSSPPVSTPAPTAPEPEPPWDAAPTRTASIATAKPAAPALVSPPPVSAPAPATPEPEPEPRRMTAS